MKSGCHAPLRRAGLALALALTACVAGLGQQAGSPAARGRQENAAELRHYSWVSRTEVRKGGETKSRRMYRMRYGADGAVQQTLVTETAQQIPTRGLRGLIAKKKKGDFVELLDELGTLAKAYGRLSPERMQQFVARASVTPETRLRPGLLRLEGRDVLQPGDSMTVWVEAATRRQRRVEVQTVFDGKPVRIVSEFQDLPEGPTYMARSVVDYPSEELAITTDNFDYTREE